MDTVDLCFFRDTRKKPAACFMKALSRTIHAQDKWLWPVKDYNYMKENLVR